MGCRHGPDHDESDGMVCGHEFDDMGLIMMSMMAWYVGVVCGHGPDHDESDGMVCGHGMWAWA